MNNQSIIERIVLQCIVEVRGPGLYKNHIIIEYLPGNKIISKTKNCASVGPETSRTWAKYLEVFFFTFHEKSGIISQIQGRREDHD